MRGIYIRLDDDFLRRFDDAARRLGYLRSEAIREAMRRFIMSIEGGRETSKIRGLVKSKLSLRELEEAYMVMK